MAGLAEDRADEQRPNVPVAKWDAGGAADDRVTRHCGDANRARGKRIRAPGEERPRLAAEAGVSGWRLVEIGFNGDGIDLREGIPLELLDEERHAAIGAAGEERTVGDEERAFVSDADGGESHKREREVHESSVRSKMGGDLGEVNRDSRALGRRSGEALPVPRS